MKRFREFFETEGRAEGTEGELGRRLLLIGDGLIWS